MNIDQRIRKEGENYIIKDICVTQGEIIDNAIDETYRHCNKLAKMSDRQATLYNVLYVLSVLVILGCSVGVIFLSQRGSTDNAYTTALGAIIFGVKSIASTFAVDKKGSLYKEQNRRLRGIARDVFRLKSSQLDAERLLDRLDSYHDDIDDIDIGMYDLGSNRPRIRLIRDRRNNPTESPSNESMSELTTVIRKARLESVISTINNEDKSQIPV